MLSEYLTVVIYSLPSYIDLGRKSGKEERAGVWNFKQKKICWGMQDTAEGLDGTIALPQVQAGRGEEERSRKVVG